MGQKVHPIGFRLGYVKDWEAKWFAKRNYSESLHEDLKIREFIERTLPYAGISKIVIERFGQNVRVNIHTSRPGIVIGRGGKEVDNLRDNLQKLSKSQLHIEIHEIKVPERDARLLAKSIASQLSKRVSYRRVMKQAVSQAQNAGILGIKVVCSGRLGGQELARTEWYREGRVPLHTIRADIDYGLSEALTQYGKIGVKVWLFKGEIIGDRKDVDAKKGEI